MAVLKYAEGVAERLEEARKLAQTLPVGAYETLQWSLDHLRAMGNRSGRYTEVTLYTDFAPYSLGFSVSMFCMETQKMEFWICGGLVYGASKTWTEYPNHPYMDFPGRGPGWSVHT